MNDIYRKQQRPEFIKLLAAQKQVYTEGKRVNSLILFSSALLAIVVPILLYYLKQAPETQGYSQIVAIVGSLVSIGIALLLKDVPRKKAETAAKIQEEFDTTLFELPWNEAKAGNKVRDHVIERAAMRLKDRSNIDEKPWYSDYSNLPHDEAVLHCQEENLDWDSTLRKKYARRLRIAAIGIFIFGWVWGFEVLKLDSRAFLLQVFFPFSGFLIYLYHNTRKNFESSIKQAEKGAYAKALHERYHHSKKSIPTSELRKLQDAIYERRKEGDLVPDWFYKLSQKTFEQVHDNRAKSKNT